MICQQGLPHRGWSLLYPLGPKVGGGGPVSQELPGRIDTLAVAWDRLHFLAFALDPEVQVWKPGLKPLLCWSQDAPSSARSESEGGVAQHSKSGTCQREVCQGNVPTTELGLLHILHFINILHFWVAGQRQCGERISMWLTCCWVYYISFGRNILYKSQAEACRFQASFFRVPVRAHISFSLCFFA